VVIEELELQLEAHRAELTGYCYRMLGSAFEADDAAQETLVRAWRKHDSFEGRSALRSWLFSIATNVCLDLLRGRQRRALPMDLTAPSPGDGASGPALPESTWIQPIPDGRVVAAMGDPAELAVARDSVRLAFIAALQHLVPRQRAVLILRDVLKWKAAEVAELLDTTVVSVNSGLRRARATLAAVDVSATEPSAPNDHEQRALLARYVDAFESYDVDALVSLLHEDATLTMPPMSFWLRGRADLRQWWLGEGTACRGSRLVRTRANGGPAVAAYRPSVAGGYEASSIQLVETSAGRITAINVFLEPELFPLFDLPVRIEG
jgi:RNA polymerase sigma-70 factor, ECF subfamily